MVELFSMKSFIEKTLVILKPDSVQRSLISEIIGRFERIGLKFIGIKMVLADKKTIREHYMVDPTWVEKVGEKTIESMKSAGEDVSGLNPKTQGEKILGVLVNYMTCGPVVVIAIEGAHSVELVRKLVGSTEPLSSDVGTIRGDYVLDSYSMADSNGRSIRNLIHASTSTEDAKKELKIWFQDSELLGYETAQEHILYDINFDNAKE